MDDLLAMNRIHDCRPCRLFLRSSDSEFARDELLPLVVAPARFMRVVIGDGAENIRPILTLVSGTTPKEGAKTVNGPLCPCALLLSALWSDETAEPVTSSLHGAFLPDKTLELICEFVLNVKRRLNNFRHVVDHVKRIFAMLHAKFDCLVGIIAKVCVPSVSANRAKI